MHCRHKGERDLDHPCVLRSAVCVQDGEANTSTAGTRAREISTTLVGSAAMCAQEGKASTSTAGTETVIT